MTIIHVEAQIHVKGKSLPGFVCLQLLACFTKGKVAAFCKVYQQHIGFSLAWQRLAAPAFETCLQAGGPWL